MNRSCRVLRSRVPARALQAVTASVMVPAAAYGQLTTAPVPVVVPVFPGWSLTLLTLAIALLFVAGLSRRSRAGRSFTAGAAAIVACLAAWESPALKAQLSLVFTDPAGEAVDIPLEPVVAGEDIVDFALPSFRNVSGKPLLIAAVDPPGYAECFPDGLRLPLQLPPPGEREFPACEVGLEMISDRQPASLGPDGCHYDVARACQAAADATLAALEITPDSKAIPVFQPMESFVITNSAAAPGPAENIRFTAPQALTLSDDCGPSLAPGASCTLTVEAGEVGGPYALTARGDNSYELSASLTADRVRLSIDPASAQFEAFDGVGRFTLTHDGNFSVAAVDISVEGPEQVVVGGSCGSSLAPGESCSLDIVVNGEGGPVPLQVGGSNSNTLAVSVTATAWDPEAEVSDAEAAALAALLDAGSSCNPFDALPFNGQLLALLPDNLLATMPSTSEAATENGYEVRSCGSFTLMVQRLPDGSPVRTLLLIEGAIEPTAGGLLNTLDQSMLTDTVIYQVAAGYEAPSLLPAQLPRRLGDAVIRSYGGSLSLKAGEHVTGRVTLRGLLADVVGAMGYPTQDVVLTTGRELPPVAWQTAAGAAAGAQEPGTSFDDGLKPTRYIELAHQGVWSNSAGIQGLSLTDSTVYYDEDNNFGFWGVGSFQSNPVAMFYNGPLKVSKDPQDYLAAQVGFGARDITLSQYLAFLAAYSNRYPYLAGEALGAGAPSTDTLFKPVSDSLGLVPLDIVKVSNDALGAFVAGFRSGDAFPTLDKFNLVALGPLATSQDGTNGPLVKVRGDGKVLNQAVAAVDLTLSASGASGSASGDLVIPMPTIAGINLGSIGAASSLAISASPGTRSMQLNATLNAGPFSSVPLGLAFNNNQVSFSLAPNCSVPAGLAASAQLGGNRSALTPGSLAWSPSVSLPSPASLVSCAGDIYAFIANGVVYMFSAGEQLLSYGAGLLPQNDVTRIGIEGIGYAGGVLRAAPAELFNVASSVPGAPQLASAAAVARGALTSALTAGLDFVAGSTLDAAGSFFDSIAGLIGSISDGIAEFLGAGASSPDGFGFVFVQGVAAEDITVGHLGDVWTIDKGKPYLYNGPNTFSWTRSDNGLPAHIAFRRIDMGDSLVAAIDQFGQLWTTGIGSINWRQANAYAVDVGVGGGQLWRVSAQPDGGGYRIFRASVAGNPNFNWVDMQGSGMKIDVGGDGCAWTINNTYDVFEYTTENNNPDVPNRPWDPGGWSYRNFQAVDVALGEGSRAWFTGFPYSAAGGGGSLFTYNIPDAITGFASGKPVWELLQGTAANIAAGVGDRVWVSRALETGDRAGWVFAGSGRGGYDSRFDCR